MGLEDLTGSDKFPDAFVNTNPSGGDSPSEGDDHMRGIKNVIQNWADTWGGATIETGVTELIDTKLDAENFAQTDVDETITGSWTFDAEINGASMVLTGGLSADSATITNHIDAATLTTTGAITAQTVTSKNPITVTGPTGTDRLVYFEDDGGTVKGWVGWVNGTSSMILADNNTSNRVIMDQAAANITEAIWLDCESVLLGKGFQGRNGTGGAFQNGRMSMYWTGTNVAMFVDNVNRGLIINTSDGRLKNVTAPKDDALAVLKQINPTGFRWRDDPTYLQEDDGRDHYGIIAQNLLGVFPEGLHTVDENEPLLSDDGEPIAGSFQPMSVDTLALVGLLIQGVKELSDEVDNLKQQLNP